VANRAAVGFIGIGAMGEPMARAVHAAGFSVTASAHHNRAPLERLVAEGIMPAAGPAGVAAASDIVVTVVPDAPQVEEVLFGERGAASAARAGTLFIDMSTVSPIASRAFSERLRAAGHRFVDAPVSGGPARASAGTLAIMAGGDDADYAAAEPILQAMGTPHHVGGVGMGETVKLVNQLLIASIMVANAEAMTFAKKAGADLESVRKVIGSATGANYLLEQWLPKTWFAESFEGGFALDLLRKDLNAALDAARTMKLAMPATAFAYQLYTAQSAQGDGARDYSVVARFYERLAGD
jgi:3-hydroxyisobutyrate dehydrogenase-like beta-hydroxyacid dehydrogenase